MMLTKEQILSCERMEETGGPKSYAGAMLYHQYKSNKKNKNMENDREKEEMKDIVIRKVQNIQELEKELKQQKIELQILLKNIS